MNVRTASRPCCGLVIDKPEVATPACRARQSSHCQTPIERRSRAIQVNYAGRLLQEDVILGKVRREAKQRPHPICFVRTACSGWVMRSSTRPEEPPYVRQFRMGVECPLVDPFRVNEVEQRLARRFVEMDSHAAGLGARGLQNAHQLVTQL